MSIPLHAIIVLCNSTKFVVKYDGTEISASKIIKEYDGDPCTFKILSLRAGLTKLSVKEYVEDPQRSLFIDYKYGNSVYRKICSSNVIFLISSDDLNLYFKCHQDVLRESQLPIYGHNIEITNIDKGTDKYTFNITIGHEDGTDVFTSYRNRKKKFTDKYLLTQIIRYELGYMAEEQLSVFKRDFFEPQEGNHELEYEYVRSIDARIIERNVLPEKMEKYATTDEFPRFIIILVDKADGDSLYEPFAKQTIYWRRYKPSKRPKGREVVEYIVCKRLVICKDNKIYTIRSDTNEAVEIDLLFNKKNYIFITKDNPELREKIKSMNLVQTIFTLHLKTVGCVYDLDHIHGPRMVNIGIHDKISELLNESMRSDNMIPIITHKPIIDHIDDIVHLASMCDFDDKAILMEEYV